MSSLAAYFLDVRTLAANLSTAVKADTGRELSYGDVSIRLLPRPALRISDLRFSNASGGSQPWMLRIDQLNADIDLLALLRGQVRIENVDLRDATVLLETDAAGQGNWAMGKTGEAPVWMRTLEIDEFKADNIALNYRDSVSGKAWSVQLKAVRIEAPSSGRPVTLDLQAEINGKDLHVSGSIGALSAIADNLAAFPINLDATQGATQLSFTGTVDQPRTLNNFQMTLNVAAAETAELAELAGVVLTPVGPLRGAAQLSGSLAAPKLSAIDLTAGGGEAPEIKLSGGIANLRTVSGVDVKVAASAIKPWLAWSNVAVAGPVTMPPFRLNARLGEMPRGYRIDDFDLKIADSDVSASLQVLRVGTRLRVTGKVSSPLIDLTRMAPVTNRIAVPADKRELSNPTNLWQVADADLQLNIGRLVLSDGRELHTGSGRVVLDNGRLNTLTLEAAVTAGKLKIDGSIAEPHTRTGLDLQVAAQGDELAELFKFFGKPIGPVGPYRAQAQLHGALGSIGISGIDATAGRSGQTLKIKGKIDNAIRRQGIQLALNTTISDVTAAGRLFGMDLPRMPVLKVAANLSSADDGYALDELRLALGRTSVAGQVAFFPSEPRPRITASLSGALVDLSQLQFGASAADTNNPLLAADIDATVKFDQVVLGKKRKLNAVAGNLRLTSGVVTLKQFSVAIDGASASADGTIKEPLRPAGIDLTMSAKLTRGNGLSALTGMHLDGLPPFTATTKVTDVLGGYALSDLKLVTAPASLSGSVTVIQDAKRFKVTARANSPLLDIGKILGSTGKKGTRVIPDLQLPLDALEAIDADLDLHFDAVKFDEAVPMGPLLVRATIVDGLLTAKPVQLAIDPGKLINLALTADAAQSNWTLRVDGTGIDFGQLLAHVGRPGLVAGGRTDLTVQLEGRGKSTSALLASLKGEARVSIGPHVVRNFAVNPQASIVLRAISPSTSGQDTEVTCLVANVPIRDGVINSVRNVAAETKKYNAVLAGQVNLADETINASIVPVLINTLGIGDVKAVIKLRGNIFEPVVEVNTVDVAVKSVASMGAAIFTLGGSLVADALFNKVVSDPTPCATALAQ